MFHSHWRGECDGCSVNVRNALVATFPDREVLFLPNMHLHEHIPQRNKRAPHHRLAEIVQ